jgi:multidrug transporter EmrE-like cation transporter
MTVRIFAMVLFSVGLSALAQIAMKRGMSSADIQRHIDTPIQALISAAGNGPVVLGLAMYAVSAVAWLLVLARLDVSLAYPFVALGFVVTMLLGALLLGEEIGPLRIAGTMLVGCGVILLARS